MEWLFCILSGLVLSVRCAPTSTPSKLETNTKEELSFAKQFMSRFGYIQTGDSLAESLVLVEHAIKDVQRFGGIPETGLLDNSTIQLMKSPRCGLPDVVAAQPKRSKRFILATSQGWTKRHLTYFIANWSPKLGLPAVRRELRTALDAWAKYSSLRFEEVSSPVADIIVSFGSSYHGDPYPFDGPGATLAHAFFPGQFGSLAGDIHFDEDETWKINPGQFEDGVDFFSVAVHEIGHSLGLSHSPADGSVMNPYYKRVNNQAFNLAYDDILGMYELYIARSTAGEYDYGNYDEDENRKTSTTTTRKPTSTTRTTTEKPLYTTTWQPRVTFVGDDESVETHKAHDPLHGVPGTVDPLTPVIPDGTTTTVTTPGSEVNPDGCQGHYDSVAFLRGELFIFKDNFLWRLTAPGKMLPNYPVPIQRMFNKLPDNLQRIDAAYERDSDSNIVLFSGDKYWIYNGNEIVNGSPRPISELGLPDYVKKVDAVIVFAKNRKTYIFSGEKYWRYNESSHTMDEGYPQSIKRFQGVPANIDSAMTWSDGVTYFFKNDLYWAFNSTWLKTEQYYPQSASHDWMGC